MARLVLLAGPNGAGKTTFAGVMFRKEIGAGQYLNADDEAALINPLSVGEAALRAARVLINRRRAFIAEGRDVVIETTLSGRVLLRDLRAAVERGYATELHYLFPPTIELCFERVLFRVQRGGHGIASGVIARRFTRGLQLLPAVLRIADSYTIWNNQSFPALIAAMRAGKLRVYNEKAWQRLTEAIRVASEGSADV
jgi:predicted ABC-type ATPase